MYTIKNSKKVQENKEEKNNKILASALKLFTEKGVKDTSVQEITTEAGVAKGTFYLYFKDKYELQDYLITRKSQQLFNEALKALYKENITDYKEKIIFVIDYIINKLNRNKLLLKFISKNLSFALYSDHISKIISEDTLGIQELFIQEIKQSNIKISHPDLKLYMIIELVSGIVFNSILYKKPLPINALKPYLYEEIKLMLN